MTQAHMFRFLWLVFEVGFSPPGGVEMSWDVFLTPECWFLGLWVFFWSLSQIVGLLLVSWSVFSWKDSLPLCCASPVAQRDKSNSSFIYWYHCLVLWFRQSVLLLILFILDLLLHWFSWVVRWICQNWYMDFLLHGFVLIDTWISLSCYMDFSKFITGFFLVVKGICQNWLFDISF